MMECAIGIREQFFIIRDYLFEAVFFQLSLDHRDQGVAGHGVKLDALIEQDADLGLRSTILSKLFAQHIRVCSSRCGRLVLKACDVAKLQPEVDDLDCAYELIAPCIALERAEDQEAGH